MRQEASASQWKTKADPTIKFRPEIQRKCLVMELISHCSNYVKGCDEFLIARHLLKVFLVQPQLGHHERSPTAYDKLKGQSRGS